VRAYTELSFLALPAIETLVVFYVFTLIGVHLQSLAGAFRRLFFSVFSSQIVTLVPLYFV
jgi:hypothetical protein